MILKVATVIVFLALVFWHAFLHHYLGTPEGLREVLRQAKEKNLSIAYTASGFLGIEFALFLTFALLCFIGWM